MTDFEFPQLDKLVEWFVDVRMPQELDDLWRVFGDEAPDVKLYMISMLKTFIQEVVTDTVKIINK